MSSYNLLRRIVEGASADLFLGHPSGSPEPVLLEVLRSDVASDASLSARFLSEVRRRRRLSHPHLARRVDAGRLRDGRPYAVTEPLGRETVRGSIQRRGPFGLEEAVAIVLPLCDALEYLHGHGVAQGNLTAGSIYLTTGTFGQRAKLFDSGLLLFRAPAARERAAACVELEYMAPERLRGQRAHALSDLYSVGALLYEMVMGAPPFAGASRDELRQRTDDAGSLPPIAAGLEPLRPVIERCLRIEPERRPQSASALKDLLKALARGAPERLISEPTSGWRSDVLGKYELVRLMGEGALGRVFQARHRRLGRSVALKLLKRELAQDEPSVRRFFHEARAANRIQHPNIVQVYDFVEEQRPEGPLVYFVFELMNGLSLEQVLRRERFDLTRALRVGKQLCAALGAAHAAGVVHRDVRPENIFLVDRPGKPDFVKLLDFGAAGLAEAEVEVEVEVGQRPPPDPRAAASPYRAPELAHGGGDARADIYSVGGVLCRMLFGASPRGVPAPFPDRTSSGESVPMALRLLIRHCLSESPSSRPSSMSAVEEALAPYAPQDVAPPSPVLPEGPVAVEPLEAAEGVPVPSRPARAWRRLVPPIIFLSSALAWLVTFEHRSLRAWLFRAPEEVVQRGGLVNVAVRSSPAGARVVRLDTGETLGHTPLATSLPMGDESLRVRLELEGYAPRELTIPLGEDSSALISLPRLERRGR